MKITLVKTNSDTLPIETRLDGFSLGKTSEAHLQHAYTFGKGIYEGNKYVMQKLQDKFGKLWFLFSWFFKEFHIEYFTNTNDIEDQSRT